MILVTLGTQDKQFVRLLDIVQEQIDLGNIKDKVIVQAGCTKYESKDMEIFSLIDRDKFGDMIKQCDILITHGGVGSIITGLNNNKKVIVVPRLAKYKEHINDHQMQITDNFSKGGYILPLYENDDLGIVNTNINDIITNNIDITNILLTIISSCLYITILIIFISKIYKSEKILFS